MSECRNWYNGDPILEEYHDHEWCKDMKKRGIAFAGPVITYSFLQSIGIVNDHLADCEYR